MLDVRTGSGTSRDDVCDALEARGFVRVSSLTDEWSALGIAPSDVLARRAARGAQAELVVLFEGRRLPDVDALARATTSLARGTSRWHPVCRVVIVELTPGLAPERKRELAAMVSPATGAVLVHALHVDTAARRLWSNEGSTAHRLARRGVDDPIAWLESPLGVEVRRRKMPQSPPPLFGSVEMLVVGAVFTPVAGALLLAWNLAKTRQRGLGVAFVAGSITLVAMLAMIPLPGSLPRAVGIGFGVALATALRSLRDAWFAPPARRPSLVQRASVIVLGTSLGLAAFVGPVLATTPREAKITLPKGGRLLVRGDADPTTASRIGGYLEEAGILTDGKEAIYRVNEHVHEIRFVPAPGAEKERALVRAVQAHVSRISVHVLDGQRARIVFITPGDEEIEHYDGT